MAIQVQPGRPGKNGSTPLPLTHTHIRLTVPLLCALRTTPTTPPLLLSLRFPFRCHPLRHFAVECPQALGILSQPCRRSSLSPVDTARCGLPLPGHEYQSNQPPLIRVVRCTPGVCHSCCSCRWLRVCCVSRSQCRFGHWRQPWFMVHNSDRSSVPSPVHGCCRWLLRLRVA